MQKWGWALVCVLCAFFFLMLASTLVEGPADLKAMNDDLRPMAVLVGPACAVEKQGSDQNTPVRVVVQETVFMSVRQAVMQPQVKADANGHPLGDSTYIKAVYQAFWLGDRSG